jgi:hypothetical protein
MKPSYVGVVALVLVCGVVTCGVANPPLLKVANSGATFVDGQDQPQPSAQIDPKEFQELRQDVKAIKKLLEDLAKEETDATVPESQANSGRDGAHMKNLREGFNTCTGCHNNKDAKTKGDDLVLFNYEKGEDGVSRPVLKEDLRARTWQGIQRAIEEDRMPKKGRLSKEQKNAIIAEAKAAVAELNKR